MGFLFNDGDLGQRIFAKWRDRFGEADADDAIRLSIIRDLPEAPSSHYAALLSPGLTFSETSATTVVATRLKILEPPTEVNLSRFLEAYEREQAYRLVPAVLGPDGQARFFSEIAILKRNLVVVRYDAIDEGEIESLARRQIEARSTF